MRRIIPIIAIAAALSGCQQKSSQEQKAHDAKVAQQAREQLLKELEAKKEAEQEAVLKAKQQSRLAPMGVTTTPDGKIIIDTNKTKSYFKMMAQKMKAKADKLTKEMQQGIIEEKEAGVEVSDEKIVVDLNKTKGFMEKWVKKMEGFVKEMDEVAKTLDPEVNSSVK